MLARGTVCTNHSPRCHIKAGAAFRAAESRKGDVHASGAAINPLKNSVMATRSGGELSGIFQIDVDLPAWREAYRCGCPLAHACRRSEATPEAILVADDEPGVRESLAEVLRDAGERIQSRTCCGAPTATSERRPTSSASRSPRSTES
jgi:hypothetical protein